MISDDPRLIAECLNGNSAAFGELVRRYQDRLYNAVYRLVDNHEDTYDVVQEAFLNAYQSLDSFKGDSLFFTWLYRIAVNTAISFRRKRRVMVRIDLGSRSEYRELCSDTPLQVADGTLSLVEVMPAAAAGTRPGAYRFGMRFAGGL